MIQKEGLYKIEMLILMILNQHDCSCEQLSNIMNQQSSNRLQIKDGVLLTSLYYLETSLLISSYKDGKSTYYHIEPSGQVRYNTLKRIYHHNIEMIEDMLNYKKSEVYENE